MTTPTQNDDIAHPMVDQVTLVLDNGETFSAIPDEDRWIEFPRWRQPETTIAGACIEAFSPRKVMRPADGKTWEEIGAVVTKVPSRRKSIGHFYMHLPGQHWFSFAQIYRDAVATIGRDGAVFVEVGSWKGRSAAFLATEIHNSGKDIQLHCVDTWEGTPGDPGHMEDSDLKEGKLMDRFRENVSRVAHVITEVRKSSVEAAKGYADGSLDFVFLDAGHTFADVDADIKAWLPKVRPGGWLAGHDFDWNQDVQKAVIENPALRGFRPYPGMCWLFVPGAVGSA